MTTDINSVYNELKFTLLKHVHFLALHYANVHCSILHCSNAKMSQLGVMD